MVIVGQALKLPIDEIIVDNMKLFSVKKFLKEVFCYYYSNIKTSKEILIN